ncbi:MAG: 50S ribosomal protein L25/general stress protein Ctc [Pseudomonadota bacterium]
MSDIHTFTCEVREAAGKGAARAARRNGAVPGVIYGGGQEPISINLRFNEVQKAYLTGKLLNKLNKIKVGDEEQPVIARDLQLDPVKDFPLHVDLLRVDEKTMIDVQVPVHFLNEEGSPGLKRGGVLNIVRREVELKCPATRIPQFVEVDLDGLELNDTVHISAVSLPDGVTPTITDRDFTICTIAAPSGLKSEADEAEESAEEGAEGETEESAEE